MDLKHDLCEIENYVGRLSPLQKILLSTDGSVTQLLESITGHPVSVRTRVQEIVKADTVAAEHLGVAEGDAVNHRIVELLDAATGEVLNLRKIADTHCPPGAGVPGRPYASRYPHRKNHRTPSY